MGARNIVHGAVIAATAITLGLTAAAPAMAAPATTADRSEAILLNAMQRDLNISSTEATKLMKAQAGIAELNDQVTSKLGDAYAGSWFDRASGKLVVAVSSADKVAVAKSARTSPRVVSHNLKSLNAIKAGLDSMVVSATRGGAPASAASKAKLAGAVSWSVDMQSNQLVVQVKSGQRAQIAALLARYGDAVRIEETALTPQQTSDYLDGGDAFGGCSVGFNVTKNGTGHFLTAGHCGKAGDIASSNGVQIGPFVESWFPTYDDALVRNDNSSYWIQGPWVFAYTSDPNAVYNINGYKDSPVGTAVCKSGRNTKVTCGTIKAKNVTVNYSQGAVNGLTQHTACVQPGDSGGSNFSSTSDGKNYAEGMTSGAVLVSGTTCLSSAGQGENISYYYPVATSIAYYGVTLTTV